MSLVNAAMTPSHIMDKQTIPDGRGGVITVYVEGAPIDVAYSFDDSTESRIASQEGVDNRYTLSTKKSIVLQYHDVVKRDKDGKIFRVTSDGDDNETPATAALNLRQVEAEEWSLPVNG